MARKLKNWKQAYLQYVFDTEPPDLYKEWVAISVMASALERKCYLKFGSLVFYPNMYIVLVGPSGRCRKSVSMTSGRELINYLETKIAPDATTRVGLIGELEESIVNQYMTADGSTVPGHCSLTVYSPELTVFLGYGQAELLTDLTNWYDCDANWRYKTQGRGLQIITNVWVNILGATTPDLISSALPRDTVGGGLSSRFIFVYETKKGKSISVTKMKSRDQDLYERMQHDLQEINLMQGAFEVTDNFKTAFENWYDVIDENRPTEDARFDGYIERRATHIIKLCIILSAARSSDKIVDKEIFDQALDLLLRTEIKMFSTFRGSGMSDLSIATTNIMQVITDRGMIAYSEILYMYYYDVLKHQTDQILETLVEMEFCEKYIHPKTGKLYYKLLYKKEE